MVPHADLRFILRSPLVLLAFPFLAMEGRRILRTMGKISEASQPTGTASGDSASNRQVIVLGESTMAGVGVERHEEGFPGALTRQLANDLKTTIQWSVYARSGYTARQVREKLVPLISEPRADLIAIGLGANDGFQLRRPSRFLQDIRSLIQTLHRRYPDVTIVFINMPPIQLFPAFSPLMKWVVGQQVNDFRRGLTALTEAFDQVYFYGRKITEEDWKTRLKINTELSELFHDGVHPSRLAYQIWGRDVARAITQQRWWPS